MKDINWKKVDIDWPWEDYQPNLIPLDSGGYLDVDIEARAKAAKRCWDELDDEQILYLMKRSNGQWPKRLFVISRYCNGIHETHRIMNIFNNLYRKEQTELSIKDLQARIAKLEEEVAALKSMNQTAIFYLSE